MAARSALVLGATGVVGWALLERLGADPDWTALGVARRPPKAAPCDFLAVDLFDREGVTAHSDRLRATTHLFVALRIPDDDAEVRRYLGALGNVIDVLESASAPLERICLVHGTKWYGCHVGPYDTPAKEDHPRHPAAGFYYVQHDYVAERQRGRPWTWTTLRPHTVWGRSPGTGSSLVAAVGAYASLRKAAAMPLDFPGPVGAWSKLSQGTTAKLLAEAMEWAALSPQCANQDFNITNGDSFRWQHLWPKIAASFDMPAGDVVPQKLETSMCGETARWRALAQAHGLVEPELDRFVSWSYLDGLLSATWDDLLSNVKANRHGFTTAVDSEDAFLAALADLRAEGVLP